MGATPEPQLGLTLPSSPKAFFMNLPSFQKEQQLTGGPRGPMMDIPASPGAPCGERGENVGTGDNRQVLTGGTGTGCPLCGLEGG